MNNSKKIIGTALVGITLLGGASSLNASAKNKDDQGANISIVSQWKSTDKSYNKFLTGKANVYTSPEFNSDKYKIIDGTQSSNGTYNHLRIKNVMTTSNGETYYQLGAQNGVGLANDRWVRSIGVGTMNDSKKVIIHNSKQAAKHVSDKIIPNNHKKDWRAQVDSGKNKDSYVVEVTDPAQTKKSGITAVVGYYTVYNNGTISTQE